MLLCDSESVVHWLYFGTGKDKGKNLNSAVISWAELLNVFRQPQNAVTLYKKVRIFAFLFLIFGNK